LLDGPAIELYEAASLATLRDRMLECESTYAGCGRLSELNSSDVLRKLFKRLPEKVKAEFISYSRKGLGTFVKLRELVDEAAANAECYFGEEMYENRKVPLNKPRKFAPKQTHSRNAVSDVSSGKAVPCDLCRGDHKLWHCASFKEKSQKDRFEFVRKYKLCFNC